MHMKNSLITNFFGESQLLGVFDEAINNVIDSSLDSYKYRTTIDQKGDNYIITSQIPGMSKSDISLTVENSILHVTGEKDINPHMNTSIDRTFKLGPDVDTSKIEAKVENGILEIKIPKAEKCKPKQIKIN